MNRETHSQVILVPGTQATELVAPDGSPAYNAVRAGLGLDGSGGGGGDRGGEALAALAHGQLIPGRVLQTPYARMFETLAVTPWAYDWRDDLRVNAARLMLWLRAGGGRGRGGVGAGVGDGADRRPVAVGHSQGGLLLVLASRAPDFTDYVRAVVLVGVPFAGTLRALEAVATGRGEFGEGARLAVRSHVRRWPAIAQMLPMWDGWTGAGDGESGEAGGAEAWLARALPSAVRRAAAEVRAALADPLAGLVDAMPVRCIFASGHPTPAALAAPITVGAPLTFDHEPGDGLVPLERTLAHGGPRLAHCSVIVEGPAREHALLCDDDDVVALIGEVVG